MLDKQDNVNIILKVFSCSMCPYITENHIPNYKREYGLYQVWCEGNNYKRHSCTDLEQKKKYRARLLVEIKVFAKGDICPPILIGCGIDEDCPFRKENLGGGY